MKKRSQIRMLVTGWPSKVVQCGTSYTIRLKMALRGGLVGGVLAVATLAGGAAALEPEAVDGANLIPTLLGGLPAGIIEWLLIASAPVLVAFVAWIAARLSVLGALRRMNP